MKAEKAERIVDLAASLAAKADDIEKVLIIYQEKGENGKYGSMDNELVLHDCLWLVEMFKFWMQAAATGLIKGDED